jgi:formiminotetrahydrofolate cyclodeaminase
LIRDRPLQSWLDALAGAGATPGGGSVTAVMGAMAAALVAMVSRLTLDKDPPDELGHEMRAVLEHAEGARARLTDLIDEDIKAFDAVMAAYAMPRATDEQRAMRSAAIQTALHQATRTPLACARTSAEVLDLALVALERGSRSAAGEAAVAALAAGAAFRAAALNVAINLGSIKDRDFVSARRQELDEIVGRHGGIDAHVDELLARRLG